MKAIIKLDVPEYQIGQEVSIYFKDTMMIEGVVQEPCEDAVSRQAVLNTLDNMDKVLDEDRTVENYKDLLKECYEVLTPVTPKAKVGKWKTDRAITRCSNCGKGYKDLYFRASIKSYNYCPNCGAKMENEVKE